MKAIGSAFNDLDFVINSFQATRVKRKPAMVDNSIGVSLKRFRKGYQGSYCAFASDIAPEVKKSLCTSGVSIFPELLQIVFQEIDRHQRLIHFKQRFEPGLLFLAEIFSLLQQKIMAAFDHVFPFFKSLAIFPVTNGVDYPAKGSDHVKLIEHDRRLRTTFLHRLDIRVPHIHGDRFNSCSLLIIERVKKRFEGFIAPVLANPAGLPIDDHGQIVVPFSQGNLIDGESCQWEFKSVPIMGT